MLELAGKDFKKSHRNSDPYVQMLIKDMEDTTTT